ncbi:hypothetical protein Ahy_B10g106289 isoform B [Arachis hypogaea]|uniref:Uncharacterized protein n=1 Tax=Arachis hypogaea TaxID=3818 RepID=A0A444XAR2_ARAHY|nr:hypothetical protein Ahy_B10g106289 isoform B [Arachis hypogaea]
MELDPHMVQNQSDTSLMEEGNWKRCSRKRASSSSSSSSSCSPINNLDDGCLMHIFSFLPPIPDRSVKELSEPGVFPSIETAVAASRPGDTILIAAGGVHCVSNIQIKKPICLVSCPILLYDKEEMKYHLTKSACKAFTCSPIRSCLRLNNGQDLLTGVCASVNLILREAVSFQMTRHSYVLEAQTEVVSRSHFHHAGFQGFSYGFCLSLDAVCYIACCFDLRHLGNGSLSIEVPPYIPSSATFGMHVSFFHLSSALEFLSTCKLANLTVKAELGCCLLHRKGRLTIDGCILQCETNPLDYLSCPIVSTANSTEVLPLQEKSNGDGVFVSQTRIEGGAKAVLTSGDLSLQRVRVIYARTSLLFWFDVEQM